MRSRDWAAAAAAAVLVLWLGGFAWFLHAGLGLDADRAPPTDAIVVLTGGRQRLEQGLDLFEAGKGRKLFISGVNQLVDRDVIVRRFGPLPDRVLCCIVLGHAADNTFGNARETALWMRQEGYRSLRLVTSWYHMPRSLLEFERAMPEITIIAHPVFAGRAQLARWWERPHEAVLVTSEYHKYLAALLRSALALGRPAAPDPRSPGERAATVAPSGPPE